MYDVFQVEVESTSGRSTSILTLRRQQLPPGRVRGDHRRRGRALDAQNERARCQGRTSPVTTSSRRPRHARIKAWFNFWRSLTYYNAKPERADGHLHAGDRRRLVTHTLIAEVPLVPAAGAIIGYLGSLLLFCLAVALPCCGLQILRGPLVRLAKA
jgi:hypothetical protein